MRNAITDAFNTAKEFFGKGQRKTDADARLEIEDAARRAGQHHGTESIPAWLKSGYSSYDKKARLNPRR